MMINLAYVALRQEEPWIQLHCWATHTSQGTGCVAPSQARETKRPGFFTKTIWEEPEPLSPALVWEAPGNRFLFILSCKVKKKKNNDGKPLHTHQTGSKRIEFYCQWEWRKSATHRLLVEIQRVTSFPGENMAMASKNYTNSQSSAVICRNHSSRKDKWTITFDVEIL